MLNDWYQAVIDIDAQPDQTKELAIEVTSRLANEKIITLYKPDHPLTHISGKFAPGPNFAYASGIAEIGNEHLDPNIGGMDIQMHAWVNEYGIIGLDTAQCPSCYTTFSSEQFDKLAVIKESFGTAGSEFVSNQSIPSVKCPHCHNQTQITEWYTQPHLGFSYLAFIFWNWPPFENWRINIPQIISETLKHKTVLTYGRL